MDFEQADALNQAIRLLSLRHRARAATVLAPLGLHPGQEVLLLELAKTGSMIQAQLSEALGCEPPSITLMTRKLETAGHVRREPSPIDKRASVVTLTESGRELTEQVKIQWRALAEETVLGLPAETVAALPDILGTLTGNVDSRHPRRPDIGTGERQTDQPQAGLALTGEYEPSALDWIRDHVDQITRTGTTAEVTMGGWPTVLMTYRGAKTGKIRKTPLMRAEFDGHYVAVASMGGAPTNPQWYASVIAAPIVEIQDGTVNHTYRAREVFGDEKTVWWQRAVDAYPDYAEYQTRTDRQIPVLVLTPITAESPTG